MFTYAASTEVANTYSMKERKQQETTKNNNTEEIKRKKSKENTGKRRRDIKRLACLPWQPLACVLTKKKKRLVPVACVQAALQQHSQYLAPDYGWVSFVLVTGKQYIHK